MLLERAGALSAGMLISGLPRYVRAQGVTAEQVDLSRARILARDLHGPEGPTVLPDGSVAMVEVEAGHVWHVKNDGSRELFASPGMGVVGTALGRDGALYVAKVDLSGALAVRNAAMGNAPPPSSPAGILRIDVAGRTVTTLYDRADGKPLQGPNDLTVDEWGDLWFSDAVENAVYNARTDGSYIRRVIDGVPGVNGIDLSPDGRTLYIVGNDTLLSCVVTGRGKLMESAGTAQARSLAPMAWADGLKTEANGNILCAHWAEGIDAYAPDGRLVSRTRFPGLRVLNMAFGGPDMRSLYFAAVAPDSMIGILGVVRWPRPGRGAIRAISS